MASLKFASGQVVSTNPSAGQTISLSTPIVLNVSGGGVKVPALAGLSQADAISRLNQANLTSQIISKTGPPGTTPGTVWKSSPSRGKAVLPTGSVTIFVQPGTTTSPSPSGSPSPSTSPSPSPSTSSSPGALPKL